MHTLFVGIDVSMHTNEVLGMVQDGREVVSFQVPNELPGAQALSLRLVKTMSAHPLCGNIRLDTSELEKRIVG